MKKQIKQIVKNLLQEYSVDQRLPFDDDYFKNKNYLEQYTDWLEDFGQYGELPPSKLGFWEEVKKAIKYIIDNNLQTGAGETLEEYANNPQLIYDILKNKIIGKLLEINEDGNVYVERQVRLSSSIKDYDDSTDEGKDPQWLYKSLVHSYQNNVGGCWCYGKNLSFSYCTESNGDVIELKGYIRVEDIDFVKTVLLNFFYDNEHEIRVKPKAKVELTKVKFNYRYNMPLKGHLIVNATYFGNNAKYSGDYATVDDGLGNNQYMDRKGNIRSMNDAIQDLLSRGKSLGYLFDEVTELDNGFIVVTLNGKSTLVNNQYQLINNGKTWFNYISQFDDGYAIVRLDDKWSFISEDGELVEQGELWFRRINSVGKNVFAVQDYNNNLFLIAAIIDGKFHLNNDILFTQISNWNNTFIAAQNSSNDLWVLLNTNGLFLEKNRNFYKNIGLRSKNLYYFPVLELDSNKWILLDYNGSEIDKNDFNFDRIMFDDDDSVFLTKRREDKMYMLQDNKIYLFNDEAKSLDVVYSINVKTMAETNTSLKHIIRENIKQYLTENRESKNINLARKYLKNNGYDDSYAQRILDNIRTDIPNSRLGQCKFLLGVVRLYLSNELNSGENINNLNKLLPYVASEAHINEYDNNINNLSLQEITNRFDSVKRQDAELSRKNSYSKQRIKNENYSIIKIPDFETASKYSNYTSWCVTHYKDMYKNYTNNELGLFYFCLKNGFENIPKEQGDNCPLDEYGLSMIAVSVDENGESNTITCRWNHDMGGNDHIMTKDELEDLLGVNFYEVFKPYTEEEINKKKEEIAEYYASITEMIESSHDINSIVTFHEYKEGMHIISYDNMFNFLNRDNKIISPKQWFDAAYVFTDGIGRVEINMKENYINSQGEILSPNLWFDYVSKFENGIGRVRLNNKKNYINKDGKLLSPNLWFDNARRFNNGYGVVTLQKEHNLINQNGQILSPNVWFDVIGDMKNGLCLVLKDDKYNYLSEDNGLLSPNVWFDYIYPFENDITLVKLNGKYSLLKKDGGLIGNNEMWFDFIDSTNNHGFYKVLSNNKWSFIDTNGKLIGNGNLWFDYLYFFDENGFSDGEYNGKWYTIDSKGNFYDIETKKPISVPLKQANENKIILNKIILEAIDNFFQNNVIGR